MKGIREFPEIYLYTRFADFRKSINGLSEIVGSEMRHKTNSGALFVFMGRRKDRIKILYWDKSGYALWYKRLEEEKFGWKRDFDEDAVKVTAEQLEWLLSGINIWKIKTHSTLQYEKFS